MYNSNQIHKLIPMYVKLLWQWLGILTMNLSFIKIDVGLTYYITLASIMSGSCFLGIRTHKGLTLLKA